MKHKKYVLLIVFVSFGVYFVLDEMYFKVIRTWFYELTYQLGVSHILTYTLSGIPLFVGTYFISHKTSLFESLGLNKSLINGLLFSIICTLPMFIGFTVVFDFNPSIPIDTILISIVAAGFFEELFFRGFLFGQIFKNTQLGFIQSVFFGALYFGLIHLYQSNELMELVGIFSITFLGGILFAWVYTEWKYNLWVPIFLHALMNLSWELFSVSDNALGGLYSNVFRLITIGLVIGLTVWYKKKNGMKLEVNKNTIWINKFSVTS